MERKILKTPDEIREWFQSAPDTLAFDFETTGLNYLTMEPVGISFCDGERSCYIDLLENKHARDILVVLGRIMPNHILAAHNLKFDYKCIVKFLGQDVGNKLQTRNLFCTYIGSFLLDENKSSHSLDALAEEYFGMGKTGKWDQFTDWHSEEFYEYAMVDSELCWRLYTILEPKLKEEGLEHVFQIEMDFIPVAAEIEMNGILVDQAELASLQSRVEEKILICEDKMLEMVGKKANIQIGLFGQKFRNIPVNFNSDDQIAKCLIKVGCNLKEKTQTGKYCVAKHVLKQFQNVPFVETLQQYNVLHKLYSSYILPCWEHIDVDGRLRPNIGIARTGRTTESTAGFQRLIKIDEKIISDPNINYRRVFIAEGTMVGADYSGQELRILGEITQDETIINAFKNSYDLHLLTANHIFDLDLDDEALISTNPAHKLAEKKYKSERYKAKNGANFPIVYGSSAGGIAWRQGVSKDEAQKWVDGFFKAYPRVRSCMDEIPKRLYKEGFLTTLMGRRRRFPYYKTLPQWGKGKSPSKDRCIRQGFNFLVQGFAADQAKIAGRKIYDQLKKHPEWKARILLIVHDEWVVEVLEEKYVETVKQCVIDCMEHAVSLSVPFKVDCKVGKNYSEIK